MASVIMPVRVRSFVPLFAAVLCVLFAPAKPAAAGPCSPDSEAPGIFVPDRGCAEIGLGYQYQHYDVLGRAFADDGYNVNFGIHLFDALTGAGTRIAVSGEGDAAFGFGGRSDGSPPLNASSLFLGAGPHVAIESGSRFEPWLHGLAGWERMRFTQTSSLGAESTLGFMLGGGLDYRLTRQIYWRVQGDYVGTIYQSSEQSNYSVGSGLIFYF